jgi:superfamily II DNA or RNA helicase
MIAELLARDPDCRALVVSPAGLREQWCNELHMRFGLDLQVFEALTVARMSARLPQGLNPWLIERLVIASIDYVKRPEVMRSLETIIWDAIVFDEAHTLCGRSDRSAAASALALRARNVVMLTATPHSGDDEAFKRLCAIGDVAGRFPVLMFRRTRANIGFSSRRRMTLLRVRPTRPEMMMHGALLDYARLVWRQTIIGPNCSDARLAAVVLMRRACSSASSLLRSIERRLQLLGDFRGQDAVQWSLPFLSDPERDEAPDAELGAPGLLDDAEERRRLEQILALAREASPAESKLRALRRLIDRAREPVIVFTEYRDTLQQIAALLSDVQVAELHGGLTSYERSRVLTLFARGDTRVLLATDAASEGLNLHQRCRFVVNLEIPWTPVRLEQRAGRVDRLGQPRTVHAMHFVAAGTSEEAVLAKLTRRFTRAQVTLQDAVTYQWPSEQQVAQWVIQDEPVPELEQRSAVPLQLDVIRPNLRLEAETEAERLVAAKVISPTENRHALSAPAVLTASRRRHHIETKCYWAFRLLVEDCDGRTLWQPLVGLSGTTLQQWRTSKDLRAGLNGRSTSLVRALKESTSRSLEGLREELQPLIELMTCREEAIAATLRQRHARMAVDLLQRGLFDRRAERAETAQSALLDNAIAQTAERLKVLAAQRRPANSQHELVFGIAIR